MQGQSIGRYIDEGKNSKRRDHKEFPEEQAKYIYFHILDSLKDRTLKISNFDLSILIFNLDDFQCHLQRRGLFTFEPIRPQCNFGFSSILNLT